MPPVTMLTVADLAGVMTFLIVVLGAALAAGLLSWRAAPTPGDTVTP